MVPVPRSSTKTQTAAVNCSCAGVSLTGNREKTPLFCTGKSVPLVVLAQCEDRKSKYIYIYIFFYSC